MREFGFELALCAHLERTRRAILARQLGGGVTRPGRRVLDVVVVEPGPAFADRTALTDAAIPAAVLDADIGPGRFTSWRRALGDGEGARRAVERACEMGVLERERRGGREVVRLVDRYPAGWFDRLVGIENKPDLGDPGALEDQLQYDVSLGLVDAAVLVTESHVTRAHRHRLPSAVGIWRFDRDRGALEVVRPAAALPVERPGIEVLDRRRGRTDVTTVDASTKRTARRRLAERAYGKGWRTYSLPPCGALDPDGGATPGLPWCSFHGRLVDPAAECGPSCPGHRPGPPPAVDLRGERDANSPWVADPPDRRTRQAPLDRFDR